MLVPHLYRPRDYQIPFYNCLADGVLRAVAVWHRRCGKDMTAFNLTIKESIKRIGTYFYFFPTYAQGRKTIWEGFDFSGRPFLSYLPPGTHKNETEMKAVLPWGSIIRIIGTDKFDSIVGPNPFGCVFSEYALQDPRAWDLVRPILVENGGWAIFIFTPRGKNHGWDIMQIALKELAKGSGRWFFSLLTVDDTFKEGGVPVVSEEDIHYERLEGMAEDLIQQEFYCSFDLGVEGAYYAKLMVLAEKQGRIIPRLYDPAPLVHTAWDLGVGDSCCIWFFQMARNEIHLIDYYENQGEGMLHYFNLLDDKRVKMGYRYGNHFAPHDVEAREKFSGRSVKDQAEDHGIDFITIPRDFNLQAGIEEVRSILYRCWFDEQTTEHGVKGLINYRKEFNPKTKAYSNTPLHNWASHPADAFRTLASALQQGEGDVTSTRMTVEEVTRLDREHGFGQVQEGPLS